MNDLDETIDDVSADKISPEKGTALALLSLAKSARDYLEFLGCNAEPSGHLDAYVEKIADALGYISDALDKE
jgi:hypothetical protein